MFTNKKIGAFMVYVCLFFFFIGVFTTVDFCFEYVKTRRAAKTIRENAERFININVKIDKSTDGQVFFVFHDKEGNYFYRAHEWNNNELKQLFYVSLDKDEPIFDVKTILNK